MKVGLVLFLALQGGWVFAEGTNNPDGTVTYFVETQNSRRWTTSAPAAGREKSYVEQTYYNWNGVWYTETYRREDYDLDGIVDLESTQFAAHGGAFIVGKTHARDRQGVFYDQYDDSQPRRFVTNNRDGRRADGAVDARTSVRLYSNGFGYVYAGDVFEVETNGDRDVQNNNQFLQLAEVGKFAADPLSKRIAKLRLEREVRLRDLIPRR